MSKVYSFCFLFFYFNCSTYVTRERSRRRRHPIRWQSYEKKSRLPNIKEDFPIGIRKNSVLLFILSTQFLGNFQRLSDLLHQDFTRRKFRHVLGDLDSRLVELEKFDLLLIYQKTTLSDRTLQLKDLLPEEPLYI